MLILPKRLTAHPNPPSPHTQTHYAQQALLYTQSRQQVQDAPRSRIETDTMRNPSLEPQSVVGNGKLD